MNRLAARKSAGPPGRWMPLVLAVIFFQLSIYAMVPAAVAQPVANGNIDDIISFGGTLTPSTGCFFDVSDDQKPLCTDDSVIPCGPVEVIFPGRYWANGSDITRGVLAYDAVNKKLYLGMRTAGAIGDTDGNGDPNNNLCSFGTPASNIPDGPGIDGVGPLSNGDRYQWFLDFDCDNTPDAVVSVIGNTTADVKVDGLGAASVTALAFNGTDLEVDLSNVNIELPIGHVVFSTGSSTDCLGEIEVETAPCPAREPALQSGITPAPSGITPASAGGELTEVTVVGRPYPNPFAASMSFGYEVPSGDAKSVEIGIYNVAGRLITRLASEVQGPGRYTVRWDGRAAGGVAAAAGVYFLRSRIGQQVTTNRMLKVEQ